MLILGRKVGESIMIGDGIKIIILDKSLNRARIGIEAPPDIVIHRKEIYDKIKEQEKN